MCHWDCVVVLSAGAPEQPTLVEPTESVVFQTAAQVHTPGGESQRGRGWEVGA